MKQSKKEDERWKNEQNVGRKQTDAGIKKGEEGRND